MKPTFYADIRRKGIAGLTLACLLSAPVYAQQSAPEPAQDKFAVLGLVSLASSGLSVLQSLADWVGGRFGRTAPPTPSGPPQAIAGAAAPPGPLRYDQSPSYGPAPLVLGQPDVALRAQNGEPQKAWDGQVNYQGVALSVVLLDGQSRVLETRSLAQPFRQGERFKLRLVSTADGQVSLDALRAAPGSIGPGGLLRAAPSWAGQLYPAHADQVVQVKAGEVVYLPLGASEYFTFDDKDGNNLLALNVRQPLAGSALPNRQPVYRQDVQGVTSYAQLSQPGSYFNLTQILALQSNR